MPASCCGGRFDLFLNDWIHLDGCPKRQVGSNRRAAEERLEEGGRDAFRSSRNTDASYQLGKKKAEQEKLDRAWPVVGGNSRRRRRRLL